MADTKSQVRNLVNDYIKAVNSYNVEEILCYLHENYVFRDTKATFVRYKDDIRGIYQFNQMINYIVQVSEVEIKKPNLCISLSRKAILIYFLELSNNFPQSHLLSIMD